MNQSRPEVICCGHAAWDLNFMMDKFPVEDQKYRIDQLIETGGGPASNAASLLSCWGISTAYAGLVGDDIYGRMIIRELKDSGVDTRLIQLDSTKKTPLSAVIVNTGNGSRTLLNRRNAADEPGVTEETLSTLKNMNPSVLHFDGHAPALSLKMMELFPDALVVMDAGSYTEATDRLSFAADYVICSRRYAEVCTGLDEITTAEGRQQCMKLLKKKYPGCVIVTLGAEGLFYDEANGSRNRSTRSLKAFEVDAVDSTGAGDIFHGAFSFGLLKARPFEERLRLAAAAAALSTTKAGGRTSIPGLTETLAAAGLQRPIGEL